MRVHFFVFVFSFLTTASVYAFSNFCPKAELSEKQKNQIKEMHMQFKYLSQEMSREEKKTARENMQKNILNMMALTEEQKTALANCFKSHKRHWGKDKKSCWKKQEEQE